MDTLDAQCLVVDLLGQDPDGVLPELWRHGPDGLLTYRFAGSANDYSWPAETVAEMAAEWRAMHKLPPDSIARAVEATRRCAQIFAEGGLRPPDRYYHDLLDDEVHACWPDEKLVVIVDELGGMGARPADLGAIPSAG